MNEDAGHGGDALHRAFAPLIGLPAWFVKIGHGSFLTMEFGTPHLVTCEPREAHPGVSEQVRKRLARRQVYPVGEWHLWIYCCHWRAYSEGVEIAWSESPADKMDAAADDIDGQLLVEVTVEPSKGTSKFRFDQGSLLETWPYDNEDNDEQWMLYMKSDEVLTYRADGFYQICPKSGDNVDSGWRLILEPQLVVAEKGA